MYYAGHCAGQALITVHRSGEVKQTKDLIEDY